MNLKKFYKNKRVLITGHTGFKGTWLTQVLLELGSIVYGVSLSKKMAKMKRFDKVLYKSIKISLIGLIPSSLTTPKEK